MATIRIADQLHPTRSLDAHSTAVSSNESGGVYPIRNLSLDRRSTIGRRGSVDVRSHRSGDREKIEDDDGGGDGLLQAGDFKKKQACWL